MSDRTDSRISSRVVTVPDRDQDFTANPVELFFDLVFVFAFAQLVGRLIADPTAAGIAQAALLFVMLWLPWTQYTWSANAFSAHNHLVQLLFLAATAASVPMAASVSTAFEAGGAAFAISLALIHAMAIVLFLFGYSSGTAEYRSAVRHAVPNAVAIGLVVVGGLVDTPARTWLWIAAVVVVLGATVGAGRGTWVVRPGHFAERHGLIIIVALGEVIVATATPVLSGLEEGVGVPGDILASLSAAGVFAGLLWWGYFGRPQGEFEHHALSLPHEARGRYARDVWNVIHAPITAGIVIAAAALEEIMLHPGDELPAAFRFMFIVGLGLYLGGIELARYRSSQGFAVERAVGAIIIAAVLAPNLGVSGLALLLAVDLTLLLTLTAEHVRGNGTNASSRHH